MSRFVVINWLTLPLKPCDGRAMDSVESTTCNERKVAGNLFPPRYN
jgi:hypothetical protein